MTQPIRDYEDVTIFPLDAEREAELLREQTECTFIWSTKQGHPVGVIMNFVHRDGRFWLTSARQRKRVAAVRRDPRVSICVSSRGSPLGSGKTVTYKGRCTVHDDDPALKAWFYPALVAKVNPEERPGGVTVAFLDSPQRVILEVSCEQSIRFDGDKMKAATLASGESD